MEQEVARGYIELDVSGMKKSAESAVKALEQIDRQGSLAQSELNKLEAVTKGVGGIFRDAAEKSQSLANELNTAKNKANVYRQEIKNLNETISKSKQEQSSLKAQIEKLTGQYERAQQKAKALAETHGKESEEAKKASETADKHRNALVQLQGRYDLLGQEIEQASQDVTSFKTDLNNTEASITNISRELADAQSKAVLFGQSMQTAGDKVKTVGGQISSVGGMLTGLVTAPMMAAGTASTKFAMDAETSFAKVGTIIDSTVVSYDKLKSSVTSSSNETGVAITDFNEALYSSISAGVDSGNAIQFTNDMVKLAKGGFTDTAKAVDVVTSTLNAYGLSADQATAIADKLITTQNLGKTTVDELASSMGKVIPTAKSVNVDVDNVSAAMATLTKNGIATAEATTYYNSMLNELGKSGSVADKVLRDMSGKGFGQLVAEGKPVTEILQMLKDNAEGSGKTLSDMFGSAEASKAALTIMKEDGAEYNEILGAMKDSAGATQAAFDKMDATPAATMQKELNKLKNAGIKAGEKLLPLVTDAVEKVGDLADKFSDLPEEQQKSIIKTAGVAAAMGPLLKVTGSVTSGIGGLTKGIGKMMEAAGKKAALKTLTSGIGDAAGASTIATTGMSGFKTVLSALTGPVGIGILASGAVLGIAAAIQKANEEAVKSSLKDHFGDIKLSAEEVEDVANRLTTRDWTIKLDAAIEAKGKLEEFETQMQTAVDEMDKAAWKVSVGMDLTEEEKVSFKQSVTDYVSGVQGYVEQQHYTANLAIDALLIKGTSSYTNIEGFTNQYYNELNGKLTELGTELADITNKAWEDGFLSEEEMKLIGQKRQEIQEELDKIAQAEYDLELNNLTVEASKDGLSIESFRDLRSAIQEKMDGRKEELEESKMQLLIPYQIKLNEGDINQAEFDRAAKEAELLASRKFGNLVVDNVNLQLRTIKGNYEEVAGLSVDQLVKYFNDEIGRVGAENGGVEWQDFWYGVEQQFKGGVEGLDSSTRGAVQQLLKEMEPDVAEMERVAEEWRSAGREVPQGIQDGLAEYYELMAMSGTGDMDAIYSALSYQIANSPAKLDAIAQAKLAGERVPDELISALASKQNLVYENGKFTYMQLKQSADDSMAELSLAMDACGMTVTDSLITSLTRQGPSVQATAAGLLNTLGTGAMLGQEDVKTLLTTLGVEIPDALIQSISMQESHVQEQAISLLSKLVQGGKLKEGELKETFRAMGLSTSDELIGSLAGKEGPAQQQMIALLAKMKTGAKEECPRIATYLNEQGVKLPTDMLEEMGLSISKNGEIIDTATGKAVDIVDSMDDITKNATLTGPMMGEIVGGTESAIASWNEIQGYFDANHLTAYVDTKSSGSAGGFATGGIVTDPTLAWIAEEGHPEAIIPLNPARRSSAINLWQQTGQMLGVSSTERSRIMNDVSKASEISKLTEYNINIENNLQIDYRELSACLANELRKAPVKPEVNIEMKGGDVIMDHELVGRKTAPTVSRIISKPL
nr:MAG TPA: minor tail protein [Caudoviricetes sp.]